MVCVECDEVFCNFCFEKSHMFSAKHHRSETLTTCDVCHYQIATRKCFGCGPSLLHQCDSCFNSIHNSENNKVRTVMLSYGIKEPMGGTKYGDGGHKWSAIVLPCEECMEISAQWECEICGK